MHVTIVILVFLFLSNKVFAETCPDGGEIFARGISEDGKKEVVDVHNKYRLQIAQGNVSGQPKGINLKRMVYDDALGEAGKVVSDTCTFEHILANDTRWNFVGQNLFIESSSFKSTTQNWTRAVYSWFSENKYFVYPNNKTSPEKVTGHYTQVVRADTDHIGCDFIAYNDLSNPYAKLYTCNYGPGGNSFVPGPYKTGDSGCENLC